MPVNFARTLRSLEQDQPRRVLWLVLLVVAAWVAWMVIATIPVYETTQDARIEVSRAAFPLASMVDGRVASADLQLGEEVQVGQTLVRLDSTAAELAMKEGQAKVSALAASRAAIDEQISAEQKTLASIRKATAKGVEELEATIARVQVQLKSAQTEAARFRKLHERNASSDTELQRSETKVAEAS